MAYTPISDVAFGDNWSASQHNTLLDNAAAAFDNAAQYKVLYWATTATINGILLAAGQVLKGSATTPTASYPQGQAMFPELIAHVPLSGVAAAPIEYVESSGGGTQKVTFMQLRYATTPNQARTFLFRLKNEVGTPIVKIKYRMSTSVSSLNVKWNVYVAAVSSGDASMSAKAFATVNSQTDVAPATSDVAAESSVTITNADSMAEGDWICIMVERDTSVGSDHTGVAIVTDIELVYG